MREITLQEMLDARERRAFRQQALLTETGRPLISFCMNIPGPIKDSPLIRRGYREGVRRLEATLRQSGIPVLRREEQLAPTGPELLLSADAGAEALKALCLEIEEDDPMGRLFDMDVIAPDGRKLDRETPRCCIVCGRPGKECASRRAHSVGDLQRAVRKILTVSLLKKDAERVDALATAALIDEVNTTPKPGLVDLNNNGSHRDMEPDTFYRSARALCGFWGDCFTIGVDARTQPAAAAFDRLRQRGLEADSAMLAATGGVNTHKGAIFTLGTVCGAIGRLWSPEAPCRDPERIAAEAAALCRDAVEADFAAIRARGAPRTAGERLYLEKSFAGIRGELAEGLPGVLKWGIPTLGNCLSEGMCRNDAGVAALLHLIARGTDSNMLARGGEEQAAWAAEEAGRLLPRPDREAVISLDQAYISRNLSPGGCADLLAVSYFLLDWRQDAAKSSCKQTSLE